MAKPQEGALGTVEAVLSAMFFSRDETMPAVAIWIITASGGIAAWFVSFIFILRVLTDIC